MAKQEKDLEENKKLKDSAEEVQKEISKMRKYSSFASKMLRFAPNSKKLTSIVDQQVKQQKALLNTKNPWAPRKLNTLKKDMDAAAKRRTPKATPKPEPGLDENVSKGLSFKNKMYMLAGGATLAGGGAAYYNYSKNKRNQNQYPYEQY